ncbi:MAG: 30S ribosome-binding factor RbfA [Desulfuromonadales bacterium]|nr:30S ribosome-binding factor RbfA [Desulfuromonadales bacterium]MBN2792405.1 30S ribosome-binding factor RbfA [Desulfuromonadales bacterium]
MSGFRAEKVAEQIHKEVTQMLMFNIKDPRLSGVTITGVKVSKDIGSARIYFTVSDDENARKEAERGLKSAAAYIRRELSQVMRLRFIPEIRFQYDESVGYGRNIDSLLRRVQDDLNDHTEDY